MFTGLYSLKEPGQCPYVTMRAEPDISGYGLRRGRPPYERMGCELHFGDLPEGCRRRVIEVYRKLWNL